MSTTKIVVDYLAVTKTDANGARIALLTLNKPKALNALDLDMVKQMQIHLDDFRQDESVLAVVIDSEGEKAFCAGGDIVSMYKAMAEQDENIESTPPPFLSDFFALEYRLDYAIHVFPKPIFCWGNGIIMGGGLGVFSAAKYKIVTHSARIAMPEISIGLFPDVGASYFLNQLPDGVGQFLGLTAASINAKDCIDIGMADYFMMHEQKDAFLSALCKLDTFNVENINKLCRDIESSDVTQAHFASLQASIIDLKDQLTQIKDTTDLSEIHNKIERLAQKYPDNRMLTKGLKAFEHGSPITAHLVIKQLTESRNLPLVECFKMELSMAYVCSIIGEFQEGVRALLIDKDNAPNWRYNSFSDVPRQIVEKHFTFFQDTGTSHPLNDLAQRYGEHHA